MSDAFPVEQAEKIRAALFTGSKIEAIKLYREFTKCGLAEAKSAVEALETKLRAEQPEKFTAPQAKGCVSAGVFVACAGVAAWLLMRVFSR